VRVRRFGHLLSICALLCSVAAMDSFARAQADYTLHRPADLLVFGGYGYTKPDFDTPHNNGFTFGADYDRSFGWRVVPGLELRGNLNTGQFSTEQSFLVGPRAHVNVAGRFHPYGYFLAGAGVITYPEYGSPVHDGGRVFSAGGGVDVDVAHNFMFRADFQYEGWNMGKNSYTKPNGEDFTITPSTVTVGVTYRIPFKRWLDARHNYNH